nr:ATP-binding cassette domain-containing protein [Mycobacterium leprae]
MSCGQTQWVVIVRALAAQPEVLLLDEPLTRLDVAVATAIRPVLRSPANPEAAAPSSW